MGQKSGTEKRTAETVIKDIRRATRKHYGAEDKIRIVLEGLRGEELIAALCRREGIAESLYYNWSKEFLEAGRVGDQLAQEDIAVRIDGVDHEVEEARNVGFEGFGFGGFGVGRHEAGHEVMIFGVGNDRGCGAFQWFLRRHAAVLGWSGETPACSAAACRRLEPAGVAGFVELLHQRKPRWWWHSYGWCGRVGLAGRCEADGCGAGLVPGWLGRRLH